MITLVHIALYLMAVCSRHNGDVTEQLSKAVPWLVLPDAIQAYTGLRQTSHFEALSDMTDCSWMKFPDDMLLKEMSKKNISAMVDFHLAEEIKPCVIGEESQIDIFDEKNYGHPYFHELRIHMIQDIVLDVCLRDMVDVRERFNDCFVVKHNTQCVLSGEELREQVKIFEELGFIHLAGMIYRQSGIFLNNEWLEKVVYPTLLKVYPEDLADTTFKYISLPNYIEERISSMLFSITGEDKKRVVITDNLTHEFDKMFPMAYINTCREMV